MKAQEGTTLCQDVDGCYWMHHKGINAEINGTYVYTNLESVKEAIESIGLKIGMYYELVPAKE